ncbi:sensor histidine kinase [Flavobacterium macrobrachii]|jgi:sensor histidine kinase YesM|uniref:sensor histidine kinase n=1 Tax=Flavobacterium macrobrachii TaxID=591204 RepID=UPI0037BEDE04
MKNRLVLYSIICFIFSFLNFLEDYNESSFFEAIQDQIYLFPLSFIFIFLIYLIRKKTVESNYYKKNELFEKRTFLFFISITTILIFSILLRLISLVLFNDDEAIVFFDTLFFAILIIVSSIVLFIYLFEIYLENEFEKKELKIRLKENEIENLNDKYMSLKNQLNPHFLFNCFSNITSLIDTEPEKAIKFVEELSNVFRYSLTNSDEILVTLSEELKLLNSYFELQLIRHQGLIKLESSVDVSKLDYLIPPLTLEILIENALKHTIFDKHNPLKISIYSKEEQLIIENNFNPKINVVKTESFGIGMKSIKRQYVLLNCGEPSFKIENNIFRVEIPLIKSSYD